MSNYSNETNNSNVIVAASDMHHHNLARQYAKNYIDNVLKFKPQGEITSDTKHEARNRYYLHENERMLDNIVRNVALDPRVEKVPFIDPNTGHEVTNYYYVKLKDQYLAKDIPEY